jgi:hypothetical protein|tara:strand:- start:713 stop:928 length:216 start_codon:yes stop_codon:yes gene_type:complete
MNDVSLISREKHQDEPDESIQISIKGVIHNYQAPTSAVEKFKYMLRKKANFNALHTFKKNSIYKGKEINQK